MKIFLDILLLPVGIALLLKGADWLVDGAISLAHRLGLSPLIIGLTVVAMGTSAPEVAASIAAALAGSGDIAVGNVYGSNIANLALVGGLCALIRPIGVRSAALWRDIPLMIISALLLWPIMKDGVVTRGPALFLFLLFIGILFFLIVSERKRFETSFLTAEEKQHLTTTPKGLLISILLVFVGLLTLAAGARLTVTSASAVGRLAGLSEAVIGMTIVAVGTSLPELITCLVASIKQQDDLSIGNLIGSNIFNTLLVIGAAGLTKPFQISPRLMTADYWIMISVSVIFALFALARGKISRLGGIGLTGIYLSYLVYLFLWK